MKSNNKRIVFAISIFVLVGVLLLGLKYIPSLAKEIYPDLYGMVEQYEPELIDDRATQTAEQSESAEESNIEANSSDTDPAILLEKMVKEFEENTFTRSGWLHFAYTYESEVSNGIPLPENYLWDGWFLLNEQGDVIQHVISLNDVAGNLFQREIFKDNTFINLTTNDKMDNGGPYHLKLDLGVTKGMLWMQESGAILRQETDELDGRTAIRFSVQGTYDKPTVFGNSSQPVESIRSTVLFDQTSGAIYEMKDVYLLVDGTEELFYKVQVLTLEWDDLPEEFVQLLEDK